MRTLSDIGQVVEGIGRGQHDLRVARAAASSPPPFMTCANAVKHTQSGGILVTCRRGARQARIEVWDTGPSSRR